MIGGAYAQHRGQEQSENAVVNVRRAEDSRQNVFKEQAEAGLKKNMQNSTEEAVTGRQTASAASREAAYRAANAAAPHATQQAAAGSLGGNKVVADNLGQMLAGVADRVSQQGDARARLGSFGDAMFDTNLLLGRGREDIGQAGNFAAGSLRPVEMEMEAGAHKGDKVKALGTLLQIAGTAMMGGAGAGAAGGANAATAGGASVGSGAGMMAQPFMQMLGGGSTFGAGWLAPTAGSAFGAASSFQ
jgi:hypothetical protein